MWEQVSPATPSLIEGQTLVTYPEIRPPTRGGTNSPNTRPPQPTPASGGYTDNWAGLFYLPQCPAGSAMGQCQALAQRDAAVCLLAEGCPATRTRACGDQHSRGCGTPGARPARE